MELHMLVYLVTDTKRRKSWTVETLDDAAKIVGIEAGDIEWWLAECGIYEGERWSVVEMLDMCDSYEKAI